MRDKNLKNVHRKREQNCEACDTPWYHFFNLSILEIEYISRALLSNRNGFLKMQFFWIPRENVENIESFNRFISFALVDNKFW